MSDSRPVILALDENRQSLAELASILTGAGFVIHLCDQRHLALETAVRAQPDLIVCDVHFGGESGRDVCDAISHQAGLPHVPRMFLCSAQRSAVIRRADRPGGTYYVRKPLEGDVLLRLIDRALCLPQQAPPG